MSRINFYSFSQQYLISLPLDVNGIRIPTDGVQHARLAGTNDFEEITGAKYVTNEKEWIEVTGKAKKVVPGRRDQFGKAKRFGKIDRNN